MGKPATGDPCGPCSPCGRLDGHKDAISEESSAKIRWFRAPKLGRVGEPCTVEVIESQLMLTQPA